MSSDDPDIEIIKARKLKELREKAAAMEKSKASQKRYYLVISMTEQTKY